jgi:nickel/cobalt exporter
MNSGAFYLISSYWAGAVHAATPGHGKTIAASYIVGARGKPIDAVILGVFVTLSHTSGIVLVGVLASLGSAWLVPQRIEAYLALAMGLLVMALAFWILWTQRALLAPALGWEPAAPALAHAHAHTHEHPHSHEHVHEHTHAGGHTYAHSHPHNHHHEHSHDQQHDQPAEEAGWHSHGWGTYHSHRLDLVTGDRPKLAVLLALSIAGGLLPDPTALAILLAAITEGQVVLGLATVVVFSLGFASALVAVGVIAAQVGQRVLRWLSSVWVLRLQLATTLLILGVGAVLTARALQQLAAMQPV